MEVAIAAVAIGATTYVVQKKLQKEAISAQTKETEKERKAQKEMLSQELQAGEYFEQLNVKQMEMQAQASSIKTLADLIAVTKGQTQPQVFTLPAAKTYSPVEQINQAIDKMLRG